MSFQDKPRIRSTTRIKKYASVCVACNEAHGGMKYLTPRQAVILSLCRGVLTIEELIQVIARVYKSDLEAASNVVTVTLEKCSEFLARPDYPEVSAEFRLNPLDYLYHEDPSQSFPAGAFPEPYQAVLLLTELCNFKCKYCFRGGSHSKSAELSTKEWLYITEQLGAIGAIRCVITGGEPTLHSGLAEIIKSLVAYDIFPFLATNGSRLTKPLTTNFAEAGLKIVQISLDTVNQNIFKEMVGIDCLSQVQMGIRNTIQAGIMVQIKTVVTSVNCGGIEYLLDYCAGEGASWINLEPYSPSSKGGCDNTLFCTRDQLYQLVETLSRKIEQYKGQMYINPYSRIPRWKKKSDIVSCGALSGTVTVDSCGNVICCDQYDDPNLRPGKLREQSLVEIWQSPHMNRIRLKEGINIHPICRTCEHLEYCKTGCYSTSQLYLGDPYAPDPRCWKAPDRGPEAVFWDKPEEVEGVNAECQEPEWKLMQDELQKANKPC